ncbi:MAG: ABC transporter permease [Nitrososphaerales archaeon]|nr:ABC transporter permease [Nitrososphaerales archaeon]
MMISLRSLFASAWMGVQHDLSWTNPGAALMLRTVAPIASAMTTSIIYWFGSSTAGLFDPTRLAFVLVGSTLYAHIASYAWVPTQAIAEGKNLGVFPHIYITSRSSALYLAGRALSAFVNSTITSMAALVVVYYLLGSFFHTSIPLVITPVSVTLLAVALLVNIPGALGLGYFLGAYALYASRFEWALPGYIAGLLMVFSGALFSPSILPWPVSVGAAALPYTQFINAARDAIIYNLPQAYATALLYCVIGGLVTLGAGLWVYFAAEKKARRSGVIDRRLA